MFKNLLNDVVEIATDAAKITAAPVAAAAGLAKQITKPIAECAEDAVDAMRDPLGEDKQK